MKQHKVVSVSLFFFLFSLWTSTSLSSVTFITESYEARNGSVIIQPKEMKQNTPCDAATEAAPGSKTDLAPGETICFDSPNFPRKYPNNYKNLWSFQATDPNSDITMSCSTFRVEKDDTCSADEFTVNHENGETSYCTGNPPPTVLTTTGDWFIVTFRTDENTRERGFRCTVSASDVPTTTTSTTTTRDPNKILCECGIPNPSRIVGGVLSPVNHYPWLVGLSDRGGSNMPFCGGSIYNNEWIITAAHCVESKTTASIQVLLNMWNWNSATTRIIKRDIDRRIVHPNYNSGTFDNDIALLHLSLKVSFTNFEGVKPICLPSRTADYTGQDAVTTGWGVTSEGGSQPQIVREVTVPITSQTACQSAYGSSVTANMICAGLAAGGKDSCQGDSGGPLTVPNDSGKHYLAGIVSWGTGCARPNLYGVYTDVPNYITWITNIGISGKYCQW